MNDIQEGWQVDVKDSPNILPVQPDETWFHGTRTAPFDTPAPGTCFTPKLSRAETFASFGSYQHPGTQTGQPRILEASISIQEGAPFWPLGPLFGQYLDMVDNAKASCQGDQLANAEYQRQARAGYHKTATRLTHDLGYRAYWADLYTDATNACLVVLDPSTVLITNQNVHTSPRDEA